MANAPKAAAPKAEEGGAEKKKLPIVRILVFLLVAIALLGAGSPRGTAADTALG